MTRTLAAIPTIDYRSHPAFRDLPSGRWSIAEEASIVERIRSIDDGFVALRDGPVLEEREIDALFERQVVRPARALGLLVAARLADSRVGEWVTRSIDGAFVQLRDQVRVAHRARRLARGRRLFAHSAELESQGCTEVRMHSGFSARLFDLTESYRRELLARAERQPCHAQ